MTYLPLIILGAPRSGTNILRDVLTRLDGLASWPCDEINPIWRHGNLDFPTDELPPDLCRSKQVALIHKQFSWVARKYSAETVVEKTCANCLRVGFVRTALPNAKFLSIIRDPEDAICSAIKKSTSTPNLKYILAKAKFVPKIDFPHYSLKFLKSVINKNKTFVGQKHFWGPVSSEMTKISTECSHLEKCTQQWIDCVTKSSEELRKVPQQNRFQINYEDFVMKPKSILSEALAHLNIRHSEKQLEQAVEDVSISSLGRSQTELDRSEITRIRILLSTNLNLREAGFEFGS
tara:strand:- start:5282 stop:6154 length:873 start_codon:yes stop_codon:yes gene_type:complete